MANWEQRNGGLAWADTRFLIWDPWSVVNTGSSNPEDKHLYAGGDGFLRFSPDGAKSWQELAPTLSDPPDPWGDLGGATASGVAYVACHGDPHHNGRFFALCEALDITATLWRAWLLSTDDAFATHTWTALDPTIAPAPTSWTFPIDLEGWSVYITNPDANQWVNWDGTEGSPAPGSVLSHSRYNGNPGDLRRVGVSISGLSILIGAASTLTWKEKIVSKTVHGGLAHAHSTTVLIDTTAGPFSFSSNLSFAGAGDWLDRDFTDFDTLVGETLTDIKWYQVCGDDVEAQINMDTMVITDVAQADQSRPLACDLDSEDGTRLYTTLWDGGGIRLWTLDVSDPALPVVASAFALGGATGGEIAARTYYAVPHSPMLPGTGSFGDVCYVFGRFTMAGAKHVYRSTDAGVTFADVSPAGLTTERVGAFHGDSDGTTLFAVVNDPVSPALYRSLNTGAAWSSMVTLPFACEHEAFSKHASGVILVAANAAQAPGDPRAVTISAPYNAYVDDSGTAPTDLPDAGDGANGFPAIVWA